MMNTSNGTIVIPAYSHLHHPQHKFKQGRLLSSPETPHRLSRVLEGLHRVTSLSFETVESIEPSSLLTVHSASYVEYISQKCSGLKKDEEFLATVYQAHHAADTYTPLTHDTYQSALSSAGCALLGAQHILAGKNWAFAACRPPGHHASKNHMGGYCYFNNAALAAVQLKELGNVGILDLDAHHGNGTQDIFYDSNVIAFASIHAHPKYAYPHYVGFSEEHGNGRGLGYNLNIPVEHNIVEEEYLSLLMYCLEWLENKSISSLVVSLGFDTYEDDSEAASIIRLKSSAYSKIGRLIRQIRVPILVVLEGGYVLSCLSDCAEQFIRGIQSD